MLNGVNQIGICSFGVGDVGSSGEATHTILIVIYVQVFQKA